MNKLSFQKVAKKEKKQKKKKQPLHLCQRHSIGAKEIFKKFLKALFFSILRFYIFFSFYGKPTTIKKPASTSHTMWTSCKDWAACNPFAPTPPSQISQYPSCATSTPAHFASAAPHLKKAQHPTNESFKVWAMCDTHYCSSTLAASTHLHICWIIN